MDGKKCPGMIRSERYSLLLGESLRSLLQQLTPSIQLRTPSHEHSPVDIAGIIPIQLAGRAAMLLSFG